MKKIKIIFMLILSILIAASMTVNAGEIETGRIHVTINDNVYGTTSPEIDIPDETNVTFETIEVAGSGEDYYKVNDNLTIPLDVTCLKEKVYIRKMLRGGVVIGYRNIKDIPIVGTFKAVVHKGELFGEDVNVSENIKIKVDYELSQEQFVSGEQMTMYVIAFGSPFPGHTEPFDWTINFDEMLGDGIIGKILKEFTDINFVLSLNPLILAIKQVKLNVEYDIVGHETEPGMFNINATVAEGNGTISLDPNQKEYQDGASVNLTAIPDVGFLFDHWSGDVPSGHENDNPVTVTMDNNKTIQAHFREAPVVILAGKMFNIGGYAVMLANQQDTNITDAVVNITATGGILGLVNSQADVIINITAGSFETITIKTGFLRFGPITVSVKVTVGTDVIERQLSAMQIGPFVI